MHPSEGLPRVFLNPSTVATRSSPRKTAEDRDLVFDVQRGVVGADVRHVHLQRAVQRLPLRGGVRRPRRTGETGRRRTAHLRPRGRRGRACRARPESRPGCRRPGNEVRAGQFPVRCAGARVRLWPRRGCRGLRGSVHGYGGGKTAPTRSSCVDIWRPSCVVRANDERKILGKLIGPPGLGTHST